MRGAVDDVVVGAGGGLQPRQVLQVGAQRGLAVLLQPDGADQRGQPGGAHAAHGRARDSGGVAERGGIQAARHAVQVDGGVAGRAVRRS
ncbi:hypothetical protein LUX73_47260 [Actinomadura madurae]|nr:hypothetical protein [Actinomadura madurae]MCQ0011527.1 hypothetical protein [Actinomadura madurae]